MTTYIQVDLAEVRRVFDLLEKLHDLMHQPIRYRELREVEKFANENYPEISDLYYKIVWNWLPDSDKSEIENR